VRSAGVTCRAHWLPGFIVRVAAKRLWAMRPSGVRCERQPVVLQLEHRLGRLVTHEFDRILIPDGNRALDRVVGVPFGLSPSMLPSDAAIPPCAAPVCERVGYSLLITAVFAPREAYRPAISSRPPASHNDHIELMGIHAVAPLMS